LSSLRKAGRCAPVYVRAFERTAGRFIGSPATVARRSTRGRWPDNRASWDLAEAGRCAPVHVRALERTLDEFSEMSLQACAVQPSGLSTTTAGGAKRSGGDQAISALPRAEPITVTGDSVVLGWAVSTGAAALADSRRFFSVSYLAVSR
jgi:hypothetical protein